MQTHAYEQSGLVFPDQRTDASDLPCSRLIYDTRVRAITKAGAASELRARPGMNIIRVTAGLLRDHFVDAPVAYSSACVMCKPRSHSQHPGRLRWLSRILRRQSRTGFSCVTFLVIRSRYAAARSRRPVRWASDAVYHPRENEFLAFPKSITIFLRLVLERAMRSVEWNNTSNEYNNDVQA